MRLLDSRTINLHIELLNAGEDEGFEVIRSVSCPEVDCSWLSAILVDANGGDAG